MNPKLLALGLLIVVASMSGCMTKMSTYTQEDTDNHLVLYADNHFVMHQTDGFAGMWDLDGNMLKLYPLAGGEYVLIKDHGAWVDGDGDRWVKK